MDENPFEGREDQPRDNVTRIGVRAEIGQAFRKACDQDGIPQANRKLEELIVIWNVCGRPDLTHLVPDMPRPMERESQFAIHCGFAAMVKPWSRELGYRFHVAFESIMLGFLAERESIDVE